MQNDSFREKYELYGEMLYRIAFLYLRNRSDSEDAPKKSLGYFKEKTGGVVMERMDDFEMKFQKSYKEEIESIKPYGGLENRIENGLDRPDIRYRWNKTPAVVFCSIVLLMIVCAGLLYNNALLKPDNAFIIYTYADDERVDLFYYINPYIPFIFIIVQQPNKGKLRSAKRRLDKRSNKHLQDQ